MNLDKEVFDLSIDDIMPNRFQPREMFDDNSLQELSNSIKEHGVIQPIIVRKVGDKFEIIAGERRYRASKLAGKNTIPAIVKDLDDKEAAKVALLENLQRKDLTPIEEARTYQTILKLDNMTQEELAANLGKSQSTIANKLRLLQLDDEVQTALLNEKISERHARSLLNISDKQEQRKLLNDIIINRMTVKQIDDKIARLLGKPVASEEAKDYTNVTSEINPIVLNQTIYPNQNEVSSSDVLSQSIQNENINHSINDTTNLNIVKKDLSLDSNQIENESSQSDINTNENQKNTTGSNNLFNKSILEENINNNLNNIAVNTDAQKEKFLNNQQLEKQSKQIFENSNLNQTISNLNNLSQKINQQNENIDNNVNSLTNLNSKQTNTLVSEVQEDNNPEDKKVNENQNIFSKLRINNSLGTTEIIQNKEIKQDNELNKTLLDELNKKETSSEESNQIINNGPIMQNSTPLPSSNINLNSSTSANSYNNIYDIRFAINNVRQAIQNTEKFGFTISSEEQDLTDSYQFIIKIKKNK